MLLSKVSVDVLAMRTKSKNRYFSFFIPLFFPNLAYACAHTAPLWVLWDGLYVVVCDLVTEHKTSFIFYSCYLPWFLGNFELCVYIWKEHSHAEWQSNTTNSWGEENFGFSFHCRKQYFVYRWLQWSLRITSNNCCCFSFVTQLIVSL